MPIDARMSHRARGIAIQPANRATVNWFSAITRGPSGLRQAGQRCKIPFKTVATQAAHALPRA